MILDNKNTNLKVHEWIAKYTKEGKFSLVPSDNLWHSQGVMWKTKIADVVMEDFSKDVWEKAENNARKKWGSLIM